MVLSRQVPVSLANLLRLGAAVNAQNRVVIFLCSNGHGRPAKFEDPKKSTASRKGAKNQERRFLCLRCEPLRLGVRAFGQFLLIFAMAPKWSGHRSRSQASRSF